MKAARLVARINRRFESNLSIESFFGRPTVAGVVEAIGGARSVPPVNGVRRRGNTDPCPLSFGQKRFWFLDRSEPGVPRYNVNQAFDWVGPMDREALGRALDTLVERHEIIRTTYHDLAGKPVQVAAEQWDLVPAFTDLRDIPVERREKALAGWLARIAAKPFDLYRDLALRAAVAQTGDDAFVLLLSAHHIACDGWSFGVIGRELAELYSAYTTQRTPTLPELPIQYADYAVWESQQMQGEPFERGLAYWRERFSGPLERVALPTDASAAGTSIHTGSTATLTLRSGIATALRRRAELSNVTAFTVVAAALQVLLHRHSGQDDIAMGTVIAGRPRPECEPLIGPFANTVVLRLDLSGDPTFEEVLRRAGEMVRGAVAHQIVPFEKIVEAVNPPREDRRNPLFDVMLEFNSEAWDDLRIPGIRIAQRTAPSPVSRFPITLHVGEHDGAIHLRAVYERSLFTPGRIDQLLRQYELLLEAAATDPSIPISKLPLMTEGERDRLLRRWNETAAEYPRERCVQELFETQVVSTPDAPAVRFGGSSLTFAELNRGANRLAHHLRASGVGPETRVGIHLDRRMEMIVAILGVLKSGGAYVPLERRAPEARLRRIVDDAGLKLILTDTAGKQLLAGSACRLVIVDGGQPDFEAASEENPPLRNQPADLAYVIYTSGSTGEPKGVLIEHRALVNYLWGVIETLGLRDMRTFALVQPPSADSSVTAIYPPLITGGCLHLIPEETALDAAALCVYFERESIDCLKIAPSHLAAIQAASPRPVMPRRKLIVGGEPLRRDWALAWQRARPECEIVNHYGPTEATVGATSYTLEPTETAGRDSVPIGRPLPNVRAYVLDSHREALPIGFAGELWLGGDGIARGYLNRPEQTAEAFVPDPFGDGSRRLYRTGDIARFLPDGNLEYLGRRDGQVKIRGFRVELGEIEAAIAAHLGVREVAVVCAWEKLTALIVRAGSTEISLAQLRSGLGELLPDYMLPDRLSVVEALPRTSHGKLNRAALAKAALQARAMEQPDSETGAPSDEPRNQREKRLAELWCELLNRKQIGIHDNFFEVGGHSLLVVQLISRVRSGFQVDLPVRTIFELPTIAELGDAIAGAQKNEATSGDPSEHTPQPPRAARRIHPVSWAQQRLWFLDQLEPEQAAYNMSAAFSWRGTIDVEALERSFEEVARRHEVFRTTFAAPKGLPVQVIHETPIHSFVVHDLRRQGSGDHHADAPGMVLTEARRPFDLDNGPLFRVTLFHTGEDEGILLIVVHHVIFDGWSRRVLYRELAACYAAFARGAMPELPDVAAQYADYARAQAELLETGALDRQLVYWRSILGDPPRPCACQPIIPGPREWTSRAGVWPPS